MVHENEIIMLILGIGVLIFAITHQSQIKRIYGWRNFLAGFYVLLADWIFTITEGFMWGFYFNILEHVCYLGSAVIIAVWCFRLLFSHSKVVK